MRIAIYAGSFDPITRGHEDLVSRSLEFVDKLVVAVATNVAKQPLFTAGERVDLIRAAVNNNSRVEVRQFSGLLVDFAREVGAHVIVKGLRAISDFEYEFEMNQLNRKLAPDIESMYIFASANYSFLSSTGVKEMATFGGSVADLVPPAVATALAERASK